MAGPAEVEAILALDRRTEGPHWTRSDYLDALSGVTGSLRRQVFVSGKDAHVTGFTVMRVLDAGEPLTAEIEHVVVDPGWRRQGLGRELCSAALAWARNLGCQEITLEVRESNAAAIALYQRLGFHLSGRRKSYYSRPAEDALLMKTR